MHPLHRADLLASLEFPLVAENLHDSVDVSVLQHAANDTNAHEMWQKLSGLYECKNALNGTSLMRKIVRLKYIEGESLVEHINTFMGYMNQLAATKFPLDDVMHAILLMCTLPDSWESLAVTLNTLCQEETCLYKW